MQLSKSIIYQKLLILKRGIGIRFILSLLLFGSSNFPKQLDPLLTLFEEHFTLVLACLLFIDKFQYTLDKQCPENDYSPSSATIDVILFNEEKKFEKGRTLRNPETKQSLPQLFFTLKNLNFQGKYLHKLPKRASLRCTSQNISPSIPHQTQKISLRQHSRISPFQFDWYSPKAEKFY